MTRHRHVTQTSMLENGCVMDHDGSSGTYPGVEHGIQLVKSKTTGKKLIFFINYAQITFARFAPTRRISKTWRMVVHRRHVLKDEKNSIKLFTIRLRIAWIGSSSCWIVQKANRSKQLFTSCDRCHTHTRFRLILRNVITVPDTNESSHQHTSVCSSQWWWSSDSSENYRSTRCLPPCKRVLQHYTVSRIQQ